ncbi:acyl-ACP--UDP-N-acetylglucosamine O-acyltransferase [Mariniblastus sp.]|nr:acyl-ACP--UDP-N-acetylglucosamine O-acyltransferase [Mariniblastus sp.]MDB4756777.1 acyl-ACP--UDP-N-acetylglucosamine O-acyltransferase [Mariniblastus sp.]
MATFVSKNAEVHPKAEIGEDAHIGPFCFIGPNVKIGDRTRLENSVAVQGKVTIGSDNRFSPFCVIGGEPQDISYSGAETEVVIGNNNVFRESITVNRASEKEDGITSVGDDGYFMACVHIAHDCKVGDRVVIANSTLLGGHVHVHDRATISGTVAVHHFASVGTYSFVGGVSRVLHDVPPYMLVEGVPTKPRCVNVVALKRNQFPNDVITALSEAHKLLYRQKVGVENAREILSGKNMLVPAVLTLFNFLDHQQNGRNGRGRDRRKAA